MRIVGLLGAVVALSMLTAIAPARADLSGGDLMVTDLFRWQGQDGAPTWREILANFDGSEELTFYLWNAPSPPPPLVIPGTPGGASSGLTASEGSSFFLSVGGVGLTAGINPVIPPGEAVPEPSTWAMMLMSFAGLGYAGYRRAKRVSRTPGNRASAA